MIPCAVDAEVKNSDYQKLSSERSQGPDKWCTEANDSQILAFHGFWGANC